jgi:hypothetical protein
MSRILQSYLTAFFVIVAIALTFKMTIEQGMHKPLSDHNGFWSKFIAATISWQDYDLAGYVMYEKVLDELQGKIISNEVIENARKLEDVGAEGLYPIVTMDLGFIDYCRASFALFGYTIESLLYFYFLLFFISVACFFLEFNNNSTAALFLIGFLIAHHIVASVPTSNAQLETVFNNRYLSVLAILPVVHISMLVLSNKRINVPALVFVIIQSALIVFVIQLRSSSMWVIVFLSLLMVVSAGFYWKEWRQENMEKGGKASTAINFFCASAFRLWPIYLCLALLLVIKAVHPFFLHEEYSKNVGAHMKWLPVYIGMAIHPEIAKVYSDRDRLEYLYDVIEDRCAQHIPDTTLRLRAKRWMCNNYKESDWLLKIWLTYRFSRPSDDDGWSAAFKWTRDNRGSEMQLFNFGPDEKVDYQSQFSWFKKGGSGYLASPKNTDNEFAGRKYIIDKDFNIALVDEALSKVVPEVMINHPVQLLELFFFIRPLQLASMYKVNYAKLRNLPPYVFLAFALLYAIWLKKRSSIDEYGKPLWLLLALSIFSLGIPMAIYPESFAISESVLLLTTCFFILLVGIGNKAVEYLTKCKFTRSLDE